MSISCSPGIESAVVIWKLRDWRINSSTSRPIAYILDAHHLVGDATSFGGHIRASQLGEIW
jgi:hypothetical protein